MRVFKRTNAFEVRLYVGSRKGYGEEQYPADKVKVRLYLGVMVVAALKRSGPEVRRESHPRAHAKYGVICDTAQRVAGLAS